MAIPTRYRALLEDICSNDLVITIDMKSTCLNPVAASRVEKI